MGIESDHEMTSTCMQNGIRPVIGYHHQQTIIGPSPMLSQSPEPAWQYGGSMTAMTMVKQEPIDEARNDSGITSGSDGCPSASPGSDRSDNLPYSPPTQNNNNPIHNQSINYINTPNYDQWYRSNFMTSPPSKDQNPDINDTNSQISTSSNGYQPFSPKAESGDETFETEQDISTPKVNSHGKIKIHKCKQCEFVAYTKLDFWEHSKVHIKGEKILKCPKCPFVTEYKHHLEYHLLNHAGAKPFKCDRCDYSCVNKSMLNSHLKSHSKVYQYRCQDCLYETKYCHSLKLHLRKYKHKPAMVLNPDGSPNPLPIIDVYGTRRGPKLKRSHHNGSMQHPEGSLSPPIIEQNQANSTLPFNPLLNPLLNQGQLPFPFPLIPGFPGAVPNPEILQNLQRIMRERFEELQRQNQVQKELTEPNPDDALDLSKHPNDQSPEQSDDEEEDEDRTTTMFSNVEVVDNNKNSNRQEQHQEEEEEESSADSTMQSEKMDTGKSSNNNNQKYDFSCQFCEISFNNEVMFRIHMGYHGFKSVFTCNMCGEECQDKVNFFLHIARAAH